MILGESIRLLVFGENWSILTSMSRQMMIIGAVIALVVIFGVGAFLHWKSKTPSSETQMVNQQTPVPQEATAKGTIQSLIKAGKTVSCEVALPNQSGKGITYVSGNKMKSDFVMKIQDKEMTSHMLSDGENMYMWSDGTPQGTKFKIDPNSPLPSTRPSGQLQEANLESEVDLKCSPWSMDASKFSVPTNIQFTDLSSSMNNMMKSKSSAMPKTDSSMCNQISDPEGKASCLKALGN